MSAVANAAAHFQFPIGRILRMMREGRYAEKVSVRAAVYMAAVLEYLTAEVMEVAGNSAKQDKKMRITPRHIVMAIHNDEELSNLFRGVTIIEVSRCSLPLHCTFGFLRLLASSWLSSVFREESTRRPSSR